MDAINDYAKKRGLLIVKEYSDEGKSGLDLDGRQSLARMIKDVQSADVQFSCILVYDISRWGRFQDPDQSAFLEYTCRQAGVAVHYCAEQFENDGSLPSSVMKSMKRAMAGEYSRELSAKVFRGACRLIQLGYKQGGTAGYGLRRMLIDQTGQTKGLLRMGEHKSIQTDRVILVPGPEDEVKTVQRIYSRFVDDGKVESEIAKCLNENGITTDFAREWTRGTVHQVLTNEKYIGNNVYHRTSSKLKQKQIVNPPEQWIRADAAFRGIVESEVFWKARTIILQRSITLTDEEMLGKLRALFGKLGKLSGIVIDESEGIPSTSAYRQRFGSLVSAYKLIGYDPHIDYSFVEVNRYLREQQPEVVADVTRKIHELGGQARWDENSQLLCVNDELFVSIVLCRHSTTARGSSRWTIRLDAGLKPDITIAVRMDVTNRGNRDYYLLPGIDMTWENLRVAEANGIHLDAYRFDTLDYFFGMTKRIDIQEAA